MLSEFPKVSKGETARVLDVLGKSCSSLKLFTRGLQGAPGGSPLADGAGFRTGQGDRAALGQSWGSPRAHHGWASSRSAWLSRGLRANLSSGASAQRLSSAPATTGSLFLSVRTVDERKPRHRGGPGQAPGPPRYVQRGRAGLPHARTLCSARTRVFKAVALHLK